MENQKSVNDKGLAGGTFNAFSLPDLITDLFNSAPEGMVLLKTHYDPNGNIIDFEYLLLNGIAEDLLATNSQHLAGKMLRKEKSYLNQRALFHHARGTVETGKPALIHLSGREAGFHCDLKVSLAKTKGGLILRISSVSEKTERQDRSKADAAIRQEKIPAQVRPRDFRAQAKPAQTLHHLLMNAPACICRLHGPDLVFDLVNPLFEQLFPNRRLMGMPIFEALPELSGQRIGKVLEQVYQTGVTYVGKNVNIQLNRNDTGVLEDTFFTFIYQATYDERGERDGVLVFAYEVTDQVQARQVIENSAQQIRSILNNMPQIAWTADAEGKNTFLNQKWYEHTGADPGKVLEDSAHLYIHPDDLERDIKQWERAIAESESMEVKYRLKTRSGEYRWVLSRAVPILDPQGKVIQWIGTATDIHEQQLMEEALRNNEQQFRLLLESIPHMAWTFLPDGTIRYCNQRLRAFAGLPEEGLHLEHWKKTIHLEDVSTAISKMEEAMASGSQIEIELRCLRAVDQQYRWHLTRAVPIRNEQDEVVLWVATSTDIHEQKQVEEELRRSQIRERAAFAASDEMRRDLRVVLSGIDEGVVMLDQAFRYSFVNQLVQDLMGKTWLQLKGKTIWEENLFASNGDFIQVVEQVASQKKAQIFDTFSSTEGKWFEIRVYPARQGLIFFFSDITDRKQTENALRRSEEKFRFMTEFIPQIVWTASADGEADYFSGRWTEYTGMASEDSLRWGWLNYLHPDDVSYTTEIWQYALKAGVEYKIEHRIRSRKGEYRWFQTHALPLKDAQGQVVKWFGTASDIEDERLNLEAINRMKEELKRKNEELNRINVDLDSFVYAASHDLRSPINALQGLITILSTKMESLLTGKESRLLEMIDVSLAKLQRVITDLSEIARIETDSSENRDRVRFVDILEDVQSDLKPMLEEAGAQIEESFNVPDLVYARKNIRSILYNLLSNAVKYRSPKRLARIRVSTQSINGQTVLEVADNGLGIAKEQMPNLFAIFKRIHTHVEGTGIGMYIIKRIVENNGGRIEVESEPGRGTTFRIWFKVSE